MCVISLQFFTAGAMRLEAKRCSYTQGEGKLYFSGFEYRQTNIPAKEGIAMFRGDGHHTRVVFRALGQPKDDRVMEVEPCRPADQSAKIYYFELF